MLLGPGGVISIYASNTGGTADLIINVYGYFAPSALTVIHAPRPSGHPGKAVASLATQGL